MAQLLQGQWGLESADPSTMLDELTTVLMLTFRLDANVRAYSQTVINQPTVASSLGDIFKNPLHPLTVDRAQRVLKWATDPTLVHQWQAQLVPHMQTTMLQRLKDHPQPWSDPVLIEKELMSRPQTLHQKNLRRGPDPADSVSHDLILSGLNAPAHIGSIPPPRTCLKWATPLEFFAQLSPHSPLARGN